MQPQINFELSVKGSKGIKPLKITVGRPLSKALMQRYGELQTSAEELELVDPIGFPWGIVAHGKKWYVVPQIHMVFVDEDRDANTPESDERGWVEIGHTVQQRMVKRWDDLRVDRSPSGWWAAVNFAAHTANALNLFAVGVMEKGR